MLYGMACKYSVNTCVHVGSELQMLQNFCGENVWEITKYLPWIQHLFFGDTKISNYQLVGNR